MHYNNQPSFYTNRSVTYVWCPCVRSHTSVSTSHVQQVRKLPAIFFVKRKRIRIQDAYWESVGPSGSIGCPSHKKNKSLSFSASLDSLARSHLLLTDKPCTKVNIITRKRGDTIILSLLLSFRVIPLPPSFTRRANTHVLHSNNKKVEKSTYESMIKQVKLGFCPVLQIKVQKIQLRGSNNPISNPRFFSTSSKWPQTIGLISIQCRMCEHVCTMCAITCMSFKFEPNLNKFEIFEMGLLL